MKMSSVLLVLASLAVLPAAAVPTITVDSVAQNWPWSADVRVEFTLSGLSGMVDVDVEVFSGATSLGNVAPSGDAMALAADGSYSLSFDPTTLVAGSNPLVDDMVVKLTTVASDPSWSVPLYRIYDLTQEDAAVEIVTPAKLLAGEYGEWKWTCPEPTLVAGEGVPYTNLVWTGVTQDVYKTSKLVMRYLPAKGDTVYICTMSDSAHVMPDSYYIGVFETTQKQWENVMGAAPKCTHTGAGGMRPVETVSYSAIRGHSSADYWPQAPASGSFIDTLRGKTSDTPFDLPAAYQLAYAAEAGSGFGKAGSSFRTSTWPDGTPTVEVVDGVTVTNAAPGRYGASSTASVGRFAPSVQGLYDVIGNVSEMSVDWDFGTKGQGSQRQLGAVANVDPEDPAKRRTPSGSTDNRTRTGSDYSETATYRNTLNYARGAVTPTAGKATIGFRLYLPAYGDEETGSAGGASSADESSPVAVFVRPDETSFWRTATNSTFKVSWAFPKGASKATLSVVGMAASLEYPNLTATSQIVELPEGEDVCELALAFDNGAVETAKLGVVRGAQEGAAATVDYVNAANRAWKWVGPYAVFPVPYGATSVTVDGATTALDGACGWFGYEYPSEASSSSVALAAVGGVYSAELRPRPGAVLLVR